MEVKFSISSALIQRKMHHPPLNPALLPYKKLRLTTDPKKNTPHSWPSGDMLESWKGPWTPCDVEREVEVSKMEVCSPATLQVMSNSVSQPSGRSLSGQCVLPPPGSVAMETLHKPRLSCLPLEKSVLIRTIPGFPCCCCSLV